MVVKSLHDDLAWDVQRQLVNSYFKLKEISQEYEVNLPINMEELNGFLNNVPALFAQINNIEDLVGEHNEALHPVMENITLTTHQQEDIRKDAKFRVKELLGGRVNTQEYKDNSRKYFANLWNNLKQRYECSSYKDLNPLYYNEALDFIKFWEYKEWE